MDLLVLAELKVEIFVIWLKDTLEAGSAGKIVDCILGLKAYYEWKQSGGGFGPWKHAKSPMVLQTSSRIETNAVNLGSVRRLELTANSEKQQPVPKDDQNNSGGCSIFPE